MSEPAENSEKVSKSVQSRVERNRQKALAIRQSKLVSHPYAKNVAVSIDNTTIKIGTTKYKDTGGGFLLEEKPEEDEVLENLAIVEPPILETDRPSCVKCEQPIASSWLLDNFDFKCCDTCKDTEEEHKLITKTEAMNKYLLKNIDLEKYEPILKCITRKNPHNVNWGEMKLYLELQVRQRALEIWESDEKIEEERVKREEKKVMAKSKKYQKKLKELKMNMRSSLFDKTTAKHEHEFGPETYNEEEDNYTRNCLTCSYIETYEKM